jgi:hypothetical protein
MTFYKRGKIGVSKGEEEVYIPTNREGHHEKL